MILAAKRIMESESRHNFEVYAIDDSEHIPRMERMAVAVAEALSEQGLPPSKCDACRDDLIEYARQLYIAEWMRPQPGDQIPPEEKDAGGEVKAKSATKSSDKKSEEKKDSKAAPKKKAAAVKEDTSTPKKKKDADQEAAKEDK